MVPIWVLLSVLKIQMNNTTWLLRKWASNTFTGWIFFIATGKPPSVDIVIIDGMHSLCTRSPYLQAGGDFIGLHLTLVWSCVLQGLRLWEWEVVNKRWLDPQRPVMPIELKSGWVMNQNIIDTFAISFVTFDPGTGSSQMSPSSNKVFIWINWFICSGLQEHKLRNKDVGSLIGKC